MINVLLCYRSEHQKAERDVQGAGGGGLPDNNHLSYENPALNVSSESFNSRQMNDSSFMGSNDFIGKCLVILKIMTTLLLKPYIEFDK